ncbi:MAG: VOC family protein [Mycobacterium sp.]|uniref:VOC family protein n=1 Tax=Mycobacterium sp. TaxID=1785 RepID=UPI001ED7B437|nr:VOC family protein [Mycobacterium sp.]MBW0018339.1 VOC family protein [Mycobacterium sp.]
MTSCIFDDASMVATVLRVRDVGVSVSWYRDKLRLAPIHIGADGSDHPFPSFATAGSVVSLWQMPPGAARSVKDDDNNSYVVAVLNADLQPVRRALVGRGVAVSEIRRSANNEFIWFCDVDGNRFELSRPSARAS